LEKAKCGDGHFGMVPLKALTWVPGAPSGAIYKNLVGPFKYDPDRTVFKLIVGYSIVWYSFSSLCHYFHKPGCL